MFLVAKGTMMQSRECKIMTAGNIYLIYSVWVTDGLLIDYHIICIMSSMTDLMCRVLKVLCVCVCGFVLARRCALDGLQLLLSSRALPLKCFSRFIKLPRCLRQSPEWLISFAPRCRQNLWSKDPESAPGGSRRVNVLAFSCVSLSWAKYNYHEFVVFLI